MYCSGIIGSVVSDYSKRLILLSIIQINGGYCTVPQRRIGSVFSSRDVAVREGEASTIESATENFDVIRSSHQSEEHK